MPSTYLSDFALHEVAVSRLASARSVWSRGSARYFTASRFTSSKCAASVSSTARSSRDFADFSQARAAVSYAVVPVSDAWTLASSACCRRERASVSLPASLEISTYASP